MLTPFPQMKKNAAKFKRANFALLFIFLSNFIIAQSDVNIAVDWPSWSSENSVEIYDPSGTLIYTITDPTGTGNSSYSTSENVGCIANGTNYYIIMYDTYGDGWNGASNVTITSGGITVLTDTGGSATTAGSNLFFDISGGGCISCSSTINTFPYTEDFESGFGAWTQEITDNFDWSINSGGTISAGTGPNAAASGTSYAYAEASSNYSNVTILTSPCFDLTSASFAYLSFFYHMYGADMGILKVDISTDNGATYSTNLWTQTGQVQTSNIESWREAVINLNAYLGQTIRLRFHSTIGVNFTSDMAIDDITIDTTENPLANAPGGISTDLRLWLKSTDGLNYTDGQAINLWTDQGRGANASVNTAGQEPTYKDNITDNINFNPVIAFDNTPNAPLDTDLTSLPQEYLQGASGFFSQDIFIVAIPDETVNSTYGAMDMFCGDADAANDTDEDVTGIGWGGYTGRVDNEIITYALSGNPTPNNPDITLRGYGIAHSSTLDSYNNVGIINARNTIAATSQELYYNGLNIGNTEVGVPQFTNVNSSRFFIGRSQAFKGSFKGKIAEIITYAARKDDADLTQERNRIQSYLAIKYGITLGTNGISQDYVDSSGTIIWDQSANTGYNYDIAGIARDENSNLNQKQSSSINNAIDGIGPIEGILTIGLTDIYATNNINKTSNPNTIIDKGYLVWGNNNASLDALPNTITVDMSSGISGLSTPVSFLGMQRVWKVIENGGDIGTVKISIPQNAVRNISPPGDYLMFISDTDIFDPTADYRVMTINGANIETEYDFDGTKYITFGYAPQIEVERSIYFDGVSDYIDMGNTLNLNSSQFTVSAWVKRTTGSLNTSILSKRDFAYTEGYDLKINATGNLEMSWKNGSTQFIVSNTIIPENEWHHVSIVYNGTTSNLYIDGVLDKTKSLTSPTATNQSFYIAAAGKNTPTAYFKGNIDEVRVWDVALTTDQLRFIMNQEIEKNTTFVSGKIIPFTITKNEIATIPWNNLAGYYPMSIYTYTNINDESSNSNQGALRNLNTVDFQTAPLPYQSNANGSWDSSTSWLNGSAQTIPGATSIVDNTTTVDWNIVETNHNLTIDNSSLPVVNNGNRFILHLDIKTNKLTVDGDTGTGSGNGLTVTHHLSIDGKIDLEGESQLIQTAGSDFNSSSSGTLERDQQGTQDLFTYNYWSSPVGISNTTTNNNSYTVPDIFNDGTNPATPGSINFITTGYDGTLSPLGIADYWIWKYSNDATSYYNWQHIRSTGTLLAGEGFSMKGVNNTSGNVSLEQNYTLEGKPNNGDITLPITAGNSYLVGNPYASAIDAHQFILDNAPVIENTGATSGTLYFWEHWGGGSHITAEYQGGYATYNLSGGVPAATLGVNTLGSGGVPTKLPGRYIPVAQGFFVGGETTGNIVFNNGQRVFQKEDITNSIFVKNTTNSLTTATGDERFKIRLGFSSANELNRQLLVTVDSNASIGLDYGYDGEHTENQIDDMYWMINDKKYVIQGTDVINESTILPLGLHTNIDGINIFKLDELINAPNDLEVFIYDTVTELYHDIKTNDFSISLQAGEYLDRFELRFSNENTLNADNFHDVNGIQFCFTNNNETIVIKNPKLETIKSIELFNMLGQSIFKFEITNNQEHIEFKTNGISTGNYILSLKTEISKQSKKILIE